MSAFDPQRFADTLPSLPSDARRFAAKLASYADARGELDGSVGWLRAIGQQIGVTRARADHIVQALRDANVMHLVERGQGPGRPARYGLVQGSPVITYQGRASLAVSANATK